MNNAGSRRKALNRWLLGLRTGQGSVNRNRRATGRYTWLPLLPRATRILLNGRRSDARATAIYLTYRISITAWDVR